MNRVSLLVPICFFVVAGSLFGQSAKPIDTSLLRQLDSIATQDVPANAPGIATGIVENGRIVYSKLAGYANLQDSTLITEKSRFNIASNGKQFTALAILLLMDEKKLSLTDDIRKYLPSVFPSLKTPISIAQLLNHRSGIRDVYDLWSLQGITWWEHSFSNKDVLDLLKKQEDLNWQPGTKYGYSNTNYILLACIIEKVSGESFVHFTNQLFNKLNMPNTSFENDYTKIRGPIAKAYFNFNTWTTYNWIWNVCGDGNIFSTLEDQLQWEMLLQGQKSTRIKKELLQKSQSLIDHSNSKNYGWGLEFGSYKGLPYTFHEGATGAWKATVIRFPQKKLSMVTLTNTGKSTPDRQTRQMADAYLGLKKNEGNFATSPAKTGAFIREEEILGIYQTEDNYTFQFVKKDSSIYLKRNGRNDVQLEREGDNIFHQTFDPAFKQEFTINAKGEMDVTVYYTSHAPYSLKKINSNWAGFNFSHANGQYQNTETGVVVSVGFSANMEYDIKIGNQDSTKGLLIAPGKMLVDNYTFEFDKTNGQCESFLLSGGRISKVKFRRLK